MATKRLFGRRRRRGGGRLTGALAGLTAGAGLAYFLDPRRGSARRTLAARRAERVAREMEETIEAGARDLTHRARGMAHEARTRISGGQAPDEVVVERVRAKLGRLTAHAHAIRVSSHEGHVELRGPVLHADHPGILRGVRTVRGVKHVEDQLEVHETADVSTLKGEAPGAGPRAVRARWSPGVQLLAEALGGYLLLRALFGRGIVRIGAGLAGVGIIARALSESEPARREARRMAARAAVVREARAREESREAEAHGGAWHPEAEAGEERREREAKDRQQPRGGSHGLGEPT